MNALKRILPAFLVLAALCVPVSAESKTASLWGSLSKADGTRVSGVRISVTTEKRDRGWASLTNARGFFEIDGLPSGRYRIEVEMTEGRFTADRLIEIAEGDKDFADLVLGASSEGGILKIKAFLRNQGVMVSETTIGPDQMRKLPSGHSLGSLIENQDFSATTNRIDVGGLWNGIPVLFSARGSASWTQNIYKLNGLNVTDPYDGGTPLFCPDFWSLSSVRIENAGLSAEDFVPGGIVELRAKDGGDKFKGSVSSFFGHHSFSSSNITSALEKEGLSDSHTIRDALDLHADISGPLIPGKLFFFTSLTSQKTSRDLAEFSGDDKTSVSSGTASLRYEAGRSTWSLFWTGQNVKNPTYGAGRGVPVSTTLDKKDAFNVLQAFADFRLGKGHVLTAGAGFSRADSSSRFQDGSGAQHASEILTDLAWGPASAAGHSRRDVMTLMVKGEINVLKGARAHRFSYGADFTRNTADSNHEIRDNVHLRFFDNEPLEVVRFQPSTGHRESSDVATLHAQEILTFPNRISILFGLHLNRTVGRQGDGSTVLRWLSISPRLGLEIPLSKSGKSSLRIFAGRYYLSLPLSYLTYGNSGSTGGLVYAWNDLDGDRLFDPNEAGRLLRREGPLYGGIDGSVKRPFTDEVSIGFLRRASNGLVISLTGYARETRNLIASLNTGVPFSSYSERMISDIGDDRIAGTHDDLSFILYDQNEATLGRDYYLLSNGSRKTRYIGLDFVLFKKMLSRFHFFVSLTAIQAAGTTSPGNTEWENDDTVIGTLYDDPNTLVNAKGRLRFDRGYTGRIGLTARLPFGIDFGYLLKYYDGQPFARKIVVTGFTQGPFIIMAHPRGVARYEFNMTHDLRLQKALRVRGGLLRFVLDGFNIFNQHLATEENEWTGPDFPLRFATEIQSPRTFRLGLSYEF